MNDRFAEQRPAFAALARMLWGPERKPALILLTATVCLSAWWMLAQQHDATAAGLGSRADLTAYLRAAWPMSLSSFVLLGLVPMLLVVVVLRERLADYGLTLGDWKFGIFATLATAPLLVGLAYLSASSLPEGALPDRLRAWFGLHLVTQFLFYLGFEFHVRGFLQLGLGGRDGAALPIWLSIMAATLAHLGRSPAELFGSIGGSLFWSMIVLRTRSVWYGVIMHWLLGVSLEYFATTRA